MVACIMGTTHPSLFFPSLWAIIQALKFSLNFLIIIILFCHQVPQCHTIYEVGHIKTTSCELNAMCNTKFTNFLEQFRGIKSQIQYYSDGNFSLLGERKSKQVPQKLPTVLGTEKALN